jgi:hypothetical protein
MSGLWNQAKRYPHTPDECIVISLISQLLFLGQSVTLGKHQVEKERGSRQASLGKGEVM